MSSNHPSFEPIVTLVLRVTCSGTIPPPKGPELTWMVFDSTFETQPTASPSTPAVSDGLAGQSMKMTVARSPRLPTMAASERRREWPAPRPLLVKEPLDGVEHRVLVLGRLGRRGGPRGGRGPDVLPYAVVLLPALQRIVQVDYLPLRVPVLHEPRHLARQGLGEPPHVVAVLSPEVERDQHRLDRHRVDRGPLPLVDVGRDLGARVELGDALVADRDQREAITTGAVGFRVAQRLAGVDGHHHQQGDLGELE